MTISRPDLWALVAAGLVAIVIAGLSIVREYVHRKRARDLWVGVRPGGKFGVEEREEISVGTATEEIEA